MIRAGIDEAGYGPRLGPLVVGLAGFTVSGPTRGAADSLWRLLGRVVRDVPAGVLPTAAWLEADARLPVADSKVLYRAGRSERTGRPGPGLVLLETVALAFATASDALPADVGTFLARHAPGAPPFDDLPWYGPRLRALPLPRRAAPERIEAAAAALREAAAAAGVSLGPFLVRPLPEPHFNRATRRYGSKARTLFDLNVDLLAALRARARGPMHVLCDIHGGRRHYAPLLRSAFPMVAVRCTAHAPGDSCYRVGDGDDAIELRYVIGGERAGLEVALASVFAKYTRELFVEALNDYFRGRVADLRPTAGYAQDAGRFLTDLARAGALSPAERRLLVRAR